MEKDSDNCDNDVAWKWWWSRDDVQWNAVINDALGFTLKLKNIFSSSMCEE